VKCVHIIKCAKVHTLFAKNKVHFATMVYSIIVWNGLPRDLCPKDISVSTYVNLMRIITYRPLMVSTQRLTSLAYNIADGKSDSDKLSPNIKPYVVKYNAAYLFLNIVITLNISNNYISNHSNNAHFCEVQNVGSLD